MNKKLNTLFEKAKASRRGLLEKFAEKNKTRYAASTFATETIEYRNAIAHGGDVAMDVEVISEAEEAGNTAADNWKWAFASVYLQNFSQIRGLLPIMSAEVISILNIVGNTSLHRNLRDHKQISHDTRMKIRPTRSCRSV